MAVIGKSFLERGASCEGPRGVRSACVDDQGGDEAEMCEMMPETRPCRPAEQRKK